MAKQDYADNPPQRLLFVISISWDYSRDVNRETAVRRMIEEKLAGSLGIIQQELGERGLRVELRLAATGEGSLVSIVEAVIHDPTVQAIGGGLLLYKPSYEALKLIKKHLRTAAKVAAQAVDWTDTHVDVTWIRSRRGIWARLREALHHSRTPPPRPLWPSFNRMRFPPPHWEAHWFELWRCYLRDTQRWADWLTRRFITLRWHQWVNTILLVIVLIRLFWR